MSKGKKLYEKMVWICYIVYLFSIIAFGEQSAYYKISNLIFIVLLGLMLIEILARKKFLCPTVLFSFLPFLLFCYLSILWSYNVENSIIRSNTVLKLFILFFVMSYYLVVTKEYLNYIYGIAVAGFILAIYVISFYGISGLRLMMDDNIRVGSDIANANSLAIFLAISSIIDFAIFYRHHNIIWLIPFSILLIIIALTGSKKGIIDIIIGIPGVIILSTNAGSEKRYKYIKIFLRMVLIIILISFIWQLPVFDTARERMNLMFQFLNGSSTIDYSTRDRQRMIIQGIKQFKMTPIIGIGIGASDYITKRAIGQSTYLHNNYLELLATGGIIGFLVYYLPVFRILHQNFKLKDVSFTSGTITIVLIIMLVNDFSAVQYFSKITFILLAIGVSTFICEKNLQNN